jgi:hypothetical protein
MAVNHDMAPGMPGTERFQKLCSLEYLKDYFDMLRQSGVVLLSGKPAQTTIATGGKLDDLTEEGMFTSGLPAMAKSMAKSKSKNGDDKLKTALSTSTLQKMADLCPLFGFDKSPAAEETQVLKQGIFFHDKGPFLRGKSGVHTLLGGTPTFAALQVGNEVVYPFNINRSAGDDLAFALFDQYLEKIGVTDWRPDGIVLSKGADDPSDEMSDAYLKARDGELYNMRVQGPAVTSSWAKEPHMEVMPLDKVFVVIVADVWWYDDAASKTWEPNKDLDKAKYDAERVKNMVMLEKGKLGDFETASATAFGKEEQTYLTNFRPRLATSSEMVNYSALKFDGERQLHGDGADHGTSRMGLRLGEKGGEYIVGGWCIGNVLDTSASRATFPGAGNIGVRTAPNSMAINLNVKVDWWTADKMYRTYMNDGYISTRYHPMKLFAGDTFAEVMASAAKRGTVNMRMEDYAILKDVARPLWFKENSSNDEGAFKTAFEAETGAVPAATGAYA